jgi:hypothetical protein
MPTGASRASFRITALAPPRHTWDVRVVAAPVGTDIGIRIRTWYGQRFLVLDSTRDRESCRISGSRSVCVQAFPRLEAQRSGPWTVVITKRSAAPANVRVAVIFNED